MGTTCTLLPFFLPFFLGTTIGTTTTGSSSSSSCSSLPSSKEKEEAVERSSYEEEDAESVEAVAASAEEEEEEMSASASALSPYSSWAAQEHFAQKKNGDSAFRRHQIKFSFFLLFKILHQRISPHLILFSRNFTIFKKTGTRFPYLFSSYLARKDEDYDGGGGEDPG